MAILTNIRHTIIVDEENWRKYCDMKAEQLRNYGKPEMTFAEFTNLCISKANITSNDLVQYRKRRNSK